MPAKPLNQHELAEAKQLRTLFLEWQGKRKDRGEPSSQEFVAALLGFTQSALSQYINGGIPLNIDAAVTFARELGVMVDQFSPSVASKIRAASLLVSGHPGSPLKSGAPGWISADAFRLLSMYDAASPDVKYEILHTAEDGTKNSSHGVRSASDKAQNDG